MPDENAEAEVVENEAEGDGEDEEAKEEKPAKAEAQLTDGEDVYDAVTAVVRLNIPKVQLEPELDEDGLPIEVEVNESDLEDIPFEDRCLQSVAKLDDQQIWVLNQLAQKTMRTELSAEFRGMCERLNHLDS